MLMQVQSVSSSTRVPHGGGGPMCERAISMS